LRRRSSAASCGFARFTTGGNAAILVIARRRQTPAVSCHPALKCLRSTPKPDPSKVIPIWCAKSNWQMAPTSRQPPQQVVAKTRRAHGPVHLCRHALSRSGRQCRTVDTRPLHDPDAPELGTARPALPPHPADRDRTRRSHVSTTVPAYRSAHCCKNAHL
jgi:hypothetical protein